MKVLTVARTEFLRIWGNKLTRAGMFTAILIPLLYAGLYLWANWDPYGNVDKVPVAVVNLDSGGTQDGKPVNFGRDFIHSLQHDTSMDWHFVDDETAKDGLEGNRYYLMITVPADFTQKALSVSDEHPQQSSLIFTSNQGKNYLVTSISKRVETELVKNLGNKISEQYISRLLDVVGNAKNGISDAGHAASQLADGAASLKTGANDLATGIGNAGSGTDQLITGSKRLTTGASTLANGLAQTSSGNDQVSNGLIQISQGLTNIRSSMSPLAGPGSQLATGMKKASDASDQLLQASQQAANGSKQMIGGLTQMQTNLQQMQQGMGQTNQLIQGSLAAVNTLQQNHPTIASDPAMQQLVKYLGTLQQTVPPIQDGLSKVSAGMGTSISSLQNIMAGQQQISGGLGQLSGQLQQARTGVTQFTNSIGQIQAGVDRLNQGVSTAQQNVNKIARAEHQMQQGANQLYSGSSNLTYGLSSLQNGLKHAQAGADQLQGGASKLSAGASELSGKLADAAKQGSVPHASDTASVMANPVTQLDQPIHEVHNYGTGLAPYFLSLSYWVGAFMLYFLINLRDRRWLMIPVSKTSVVLGKFLALMPITILQAVVSSFVIEKILHLHPESLAGYYGFNILLTLSFTAIVGVFITLFGTGPGRFITILVLILQLTSAGGTFPIEMVPGFFLALHPFLPMTYSVDALRHIISIGDWNTAWKDAFTVALFGIASLLIAVLFSRRRMRITDLSAKDTLVP
jgi:putative membrane protein